MVFKKVFFVVLIISLFGACQKDSILHTVNKEESKVMLQLQPLDEFNVNKAEKIAEQIRNIYPNVEVLPKIDFPKGSYYQPRNRFRADSIIKSLSSTTEKGFIKVGLTDKDISVTKGDIKDFGVMGLGYRPGKACVASSYRLNAKKRDTQYFKIVIHEIGHTQGLKHCPNKECFMRDAEGGNHTDDLVDFCVDCKTFLKTKNWKFS